MKLLSQIVTLILAAIVVFAVVFTPLNPFIPAFLAILAIGAAAYGVFRKKRRKGQEVYPGTNKEIFVILVFVLLIIFITGGIKSPIFFLAYFLLFGITFIFEPLAIFIFLICVSALFLPDSLQDDVTGNLIKLGSIIILTPIAFFFGREYKKREKLAQEVKKKTEVIIEDAKEVLSTRDKSEIVKKTEEILDEAKELKKESQQ